MKRFIVPGIIVILVIVEFCLALWGPLAFVQKPSLVVALPFAHNLPEEDVQAVFDEVQEALARTRVFRVIPHYLIENYYDEREDNPDFVIDETLGYADYMDLAEELAIERVATISVYGGSDHISITVNLRTPGADSVGARFNYECATVDDFLAGVRVPAEDTARDTAEDSSQSEPTFSLQDDLRDEVRGVSLFDNLVFLLFAGQFILALLLIFRKRPDLFNQILLVVSLVLFLFAFVYAKNASMDYVQRFIANKGQINLAESTALEQFYTFIRFGPLFAMNVFVYLWFRLRRRKRAALPDGPGPAAAVVAAGEPAWRATIRSLSTVWAMPLAILSALLYALSFPSFLTLAGIPILAWVALVPLFVSIINCRARESIFIMIAFGTLSALLLNYWHGTYSYISLAFTVIILTVFYVILSPIFVFVTKKLGKWGFLAAPVIWVAFDFVRSAGYIGYAWGLMGVSQYSFLPVIQIAELTGVWGVTFLLVIFNAGIAWSLSYGKGRWWVPATVGAGLLVISLVFGGVRLIGAGRTYRNLPDDATDLRLVLVQQNTDPRKHDYRLSFETLMEQTNAAIAESAPRVPDLIVWPEGGFKPDIRYWLDRPTSRANSATLVREFFEYTATLGTPLVTGSQDHTYLPEGEDGEEVRRNFNSAIMTTAAGELGQIYHKMHLVPFTEHFPYKEQLPWLAAMLDKFDTSNWKQGEERVLFELPEADFFTPICFEDTFPDDARRFVLDGADLIVNMSNDYWSLTPVEGKQHAVHSMFRAVENRRPMVRATCSGLTTYITPEGRMSNDPPPYYTAGYLMVDIPIVERGTTLYTRAGDWLPWVCVFAGGSALILVIVLAAMGKARRTRGETDNAGGDA